MISIIIPNRNGAATIEKCLRAAFASRHENFEVVVVDDGSTDNSVGIIRKFPCTLIRLGKHFGASRARNTGAESSRGDLFFFTDADCLLKEDALSIAEKTASESGKRAVIGGTYTQIPYDGGFFSAFQSIFINYSETKKTENPDYVATHALVIDARTFKETGGFSENFLPILEDVEFSHRLRRAGYKLIMNPEMQVRHIFNYSFLRSVQNAARKSLYWTVYSLMNRDLLADSGTASFELKVNGISYLINVLLLLLTLAFHRSAFLLPIPFIFASSLFMNRKLLAAFYEAKGLSFAVFAFLYYMLFYPSAIWTGAVTGIMKYILNYKLQRKLA